MTEPTPPLRWDLIDRWLDGLSPQDAAVVFTAAGLDLDHYWPHVSDPPRFTGWSFRDSVLDQDPGALLTDPRVAPLRSWRGPAPADQEPFLRLSIPLVDHPREATRLLMSAPGVSSVVLDSPSARPWPRFRRLQWPLHVGLLTYAPSDLLAQSIGELLTPQVRGQWAPRITGVRPTERYGLLLVDTELKDAFKFLDRGGQGGYRADMVLSFTGEASWAMHVQNALGAGLGAIADVGETPRAHDERAQFFAKWLSEIIRLLGHGFPTDVALTSAVNRRVLITGDVTADALWQPELTRHVDRPPDTDREEVATGGEAPPPLEVVEREAPARTPPPEPPPAPSDRRILQCQISNEGSDTMAFRAGMNTVKVFIGLPRQDSLQAPGPIDYDSLFPDDDVQQVELTVVLVPQTPAHTTLTQTITLRRGSTDSTTTAFAVFLSDNDTFSARLLVIHRNRVLQTAVLSGQAGQRAALVDVTVIRPTLAGLPDRPKFDLALVANHTTDGTAALMAHRDGTTRVCNQVGDLTDVHAIADTIRQLLDNESLDAGDRTTADPEANRQLLVALAQNGHQLYVRLLDLVQDLQSVRNLQLVTATPGWFLPLEFLYDVEPPEDDATICPDWRTESQGQCLGECLTTADTTTMVCPGVFWAMNRTIERHYRGQRLNRADDAERATVDYLTTAAPSSTRPQLSVHHPALAASTKVSQADTTALCALLGDTISPCTTWDNWTDTLKQQPRELLVLLPHTQNRKLEIGGDYTTAAKFASARYLTGGHPDLQPVVLLMGCQTAGTPEDPAGYAKDPLVYGAAIVITSLAMLLNTHAAEYTRLLLTALLTPSPDPRPVGEVLQDFRRRALSAGYPTALGITAYGDADWTL